MLRFKLYSVAVLFQQLNSQHWRKHGGFLSSAFFIFAHATRFPLILLTAQNNLSLSPSKWITVTTVMTGLQHTLLEKNNGLKCGMRRLSEITSTSLTDASGIKYILTQPHISFLFPVLPLYIYVHPRHTKFLLYLKPRRRQIAAGRKGAKCAWMGWWEKMCSSDCSIKVPVK